MKCPATDPDFARSGVHGADAQLRLMRSVLALIPGERRGAIDAGAHIGTWTVPLAARFSFVDAFEPHAPNFECIEKNAGQLINVTLHPVALGSQQGRCRIMNLGANSGCGFATQGGDALVMPLDEFNFVDIDFIKIDVEGYEGHVLAGARSLLARCRPAVFFEDNGVGLANYGAAWIDPKAILADFGYVRKARIAKNELWCFE